jgi:hypothetical protein
MKSSNGMKPDHRSSGGGLHDDFVPDAPLVEDDLDHRIDWDRKQRKKRDEREDDVDDFATADEGLSLVLVQNRHQARKSRKKKQRHLIYDEEDGRVVARRKRKRQRNHQYEDW